MPKGKCRMRMTEIPFHTTDWSTVERTEHKGETGVAHWRTRHLGDCVSGWSSMRRAIALTIGA